MDNDKLLRRAWLFRTLVYLHCPPRAYYRALDWWGGNAGWRPLSMRERRR